VAHVEDSRDEYKVLVWRRNRKRQLERPRRRWEDYIKIYLQEVRWEDMDRIDLV
jgi:hypothetical protein